MSLHEKQYTYEDYLTFSGRERLEIIDGVPYMQAVPSRIHQEILMELSRQISNYLIGKSCKVYPAPFCVRLNNEKDDDDIISVVKPDITVVCDNSKLDESGCKGSPDMIIEILSPSTAKNDKIIKFDKYEEVGVKEYWIVEPEYKIVSIFILQENREYGRVKYYTDTDKIKVSIFPDLEIDLSTVF